ncbi:hypothetical protein M422DRAFT_23961 [Sphaerobolus stellatus SS14]|nr:hypothetical protein M422DRAFT_23961 [Sphaerobolus stellatus SS14]
MGIADKDQSHVSSTDDEATIIKNTSLNAVSNSEAQLRSRINKGEGGTLQTEGGTLYVSKQYRSKHDKKFRALVAFVPRNSYFDLSNTTSSQDQFRGFFTLFWMSMFILTVRTYIISFEQTGTPLSLAFASMFSRDALVLALSDAALVGSTILFCVPYAKALKSGWLKYNVFGIALQHTYQTLILAVAITWTFHRQWPWVQSGFLTLHTLVMIMKVHSYLTHNGNLSRIAEDARKLKTVLEEKAESVGGWDQAVQDAAATVHTGSETTTVEHSPHGTPLVLPEGATRQVFDGSTANVLRNRLLAAAEAVPNEQNADETTRRGYFPPSQIEHPIHPLAIHPDPEISNLANELSEAEAELISTGPAQVRWPENITLYNYLDYLLVPSLVYDLEFPRTKNIRPLYVFEKTIATFGTFTLLYTVTAHFILPLTPTRDQSFFRSLLDLSLPFMVSYLLLFYIIFECICNAFAELSRFADREFYQDWWNSTSWDEFSRKWNKPVHTFLLRHVYASAISAHHLSRGWATFWTFLLSASVHELVMAIVTKKFRFYLFALQMAQIPLIAIGRIPAIKRNKILGNIVFWIGLYSGFPLLCVAYCAY